MGKRAVVFKQKECSHIWRFLERWFPTDSKEPAEYVFYCVKCLEIINFPIEARKKREL